jgi:hypothetical protein
VVRTLDERLAQRCFRTGSRFRSRSAEAARTERFDHIRRCTTATGSSCQAAPPHGEHVAKRSDRRSDARRMEKSVDDSIARAIRRRLRSQARRRRRVRAQPSRPRNAHAQRLRIGTSNRDAESDSTSEQVEAINSYYSIIDQLNRGLDQANRLREQENPLSLRAEWERIVMKARKLAPVDKADRSAFDKARNAVADCMKRKAWRGILVLG